MPDAFRAEFTGERVIPGRVEDNLFNEHLARYRFAVRLWQGQGRMLDAGCGAGYGTAELARSGAQVLGIDVSEEAIAHARANYSSAPNIHFEQASCTAIPAPDGAFRMVIAFEVIEHLENWREFLHEASRVLDPSGLFLVSTPNRLYYAESRQKAGPNPFHMHEFTEGEFRSELARAFPHVKILLQNHVEGIAFSGNDTAGAAIEISERKADPDSAHFFLAICSRQPQPPVAGFVFVPHTGNVLQTRERHIALLDGEILKKNQWIEQEKLERQRMLAKVRDMETELDEHNQWARKANAEAERRAQLVAALQEELRKSNEWAKTRDREAIGRGELIAQLQEELRKSNEWAQSRDADAVERGLRIEELQGEVARAVAWAQDRETEAEERGKRIVGLQTELAEATAWAKAREAEAEQRGQRVVELQNELAQAIEWAKSRDVELAERDQRVVLLQAEVENTSAQMASAIAGYESAIEQWRRDKQASDQWAVETERRLSAERDAAREAFAARSIELDISQQRLAELQAEAEQLRAQLTQANSQIEMIAQSRWVRLGRAVRVGPEIHRN